MNSHKEKEDGLKLIFEFSEFRSSFLPILSHKNRAEPFFCFRKDGLWQ